MTYYAIFDLDETILKGKSMAEIIPHFYRESSTFRWVSWLKTAFFMSKLHRMKNKNADRLALNAYYYSLFKHIKQNNMQAACKSWFEKKRNQQGFFNTTVIQAMKEHQKNGAITVIVSGSFQDCVYPIAEFLGVPVVLSTQLEVKEGVYTGKILGGQVIEQGKVIVIEKFLAENPGGSMKNSYGYADDVSDIGMLSLTENPHVVGANPELLAFAKKNNWTIIN